MTCRYASVVGNGGWVSSKDGIAKVSLFCVFFFFALRKPNYPDHQKPVSDLKPRLVIYPSFVLINLREFAERIISDVLPTSISAFILESMALEMKSVLGWITCFYCKECFYKGLGSCFCWYDMYGYLDGWLKSKKKRKEKTVFHLCSCC